MCLSFEPQPSQALSYVGTEGWDKMVLFVHVPWFPTGSPLLPSPFLAQSLTLCTVELPRTRSSAALTWDNSRHPTVLLALLTTVWGAGSHCPGPHFTG